jgi:hypothetical protein
MGALVLSFDSSLAVRLGYDARALALVCRSFTRRLTQTLRRLCKQQHGLASVARLHAGVLVVVQRFRTDCGLYVHLHALGTDGVWQELPGGNVVFRPVTHLREVDLVRVLDDVAADLQILGENRRSSVGRRRPGEARRRALHASRQT